MDRLERFYKIDQLLRTRKGVSFAVFKSELGMSPASVKRDILYMRTRFNAPIQYEREKGGYHFGTPGAGPSYELPGLWFNAGEAHALLTMQALLADLQPGLLEPHVEPLQERLRAILGAVPGSKDITERIRIFKPERRASEARHFSTIAGALVRRLRVWIRHYNRKVDRVTEREISPQRLVHYRDNWYVDGYCHVREDLRSFAVDAIREAELRDTRAKEVPKAELDEHLASGYGIFAGRKVEWATLKFTPEAARWVSAQSWHPKQRARVEKNGDYILELPYADDRELVMEILKYGADVEVLAPPALREKVRQLLELARKRYA